MPEKNERALRLKERQTMHALLARNPNHFGTLKGAEQAAALSVQLDTSFEELMCVGVWPEENLLEATIAVKQPTGFDGSLCTRGSTEYVRFYVDWKGDGSFSDSHDDLGTALLNVHDIPAAKAHPLMYAVSHKFRPLAAPCQNPYIIKVRAILSWEIVPTGPAFVPIWGNVVERWVQIDPVRGVLVGVVAGPSAGLAAPVAAAAPAAPAAAVEVERSQFMKLLASNPNYFGTLVTAAAKLAPVKPMAGNTTYEELQCVGLYPEQNLLEAVLEIKKPTGYGGDLCTGGSRENLRFFVDWLGDGSFYDVGDDLGTASVRVHDFPEVLKVQLSYALGTTFTPPPSVCQAPRVVRVRAILSWQQVPTGPDFVPVWGNVVESWVQIRPTTQPSRTLVASLDAPAAGACAGAVGVPTCSTTSAPLAAIRIVGTAAGLPFDHYTLRYSAGSGPIGNDAIVYPDCSRPPAVLASTTPVVSGTLGFLDIGKLPPGETAFNVFLDVYDASGTVVSRTVSFQVRTKAVEVTAVATVGVLSASDPWNPTAPAVKLVKAVMDPSLTVPEQSVGGAFSLDGSAYLVGCNRMMTQFVMASMPVVATSPVPVFPDASSGSPIMAPVPYGDTPAHPWQSGCLGSITPNTIVNGRLSAFWSTKSCTFLGSTYAVPKVMQQAFDSSALNGRYVLFLETRDRALPAGTYPGVVAAVDQVAVWIDNRLPVGKLNSVGGLSGCGDLRLSDFVGKMADIRGVAWDPPIDPTAPQQAPNDNFGSYSLTFQRNGDPLASGSITGTAPTTTRVPKTAWPTLLPGDEGLLASWDIVAALDGGVGLLPAHSPKIRRGTRCAFVVTLVVNDTTHVGDSGDNHSTGPILYAFNVINDIA